MGMGGGEVKVESICVSSNGGGVGRGGGQVDGIENFAEGVEVQVY